MQLLRLFLGVRPILRFSNQVDDVVPKLLGFRSRDWVHWVPPAPAITRASFFVIPFAPHTASNREVMRFMATPPTLSRSAKSMLIAAAVISSMLRASLQTAQRHRLVA
ncbi:MAG: hypothetical protein J0H57_10115 [Rhodospirillales bacterium]|nr:hypothetical protein [Rhodospirillales bacterium]